LYKNALLKPWADMGQKTQGSHILTDEKSSKKEKKKFYEAELRRLQIELVKLQEWIKQRGLKVVVIFEGRDAAGEMVLFDRSWYNCAGVDRVMGFVSDDEQEKRFLKRNTDPIKRWKLSPMDIKSRDKWVEFSKAKDVMFTHTDPPHAPWYVVDADNKKRARLNCMHHLLSMIPYKDLTPEPIDMPERRIDEAGYERPPFDSQTFVPEVY